MENPIHAWAGTLGAVGFIAFGALAYYVTSEDAAVKAELLAAINKTAQHTHVVETKDYSTQLGLIEMNQTRTMAKHASMVSEVNQLRNDGDIYQLSISEVAHKLEAVDRLVYEINTKMIDKDVMLEVVSELSAEILELRIRLEDLENYNEQSKRDSTSGVAWSGSQGDEDTGA